MAMDAVDLCAAAGADDVRGVRRALRRGVDVHALAPGGRRTALHLAVRAGARGTVAALLAAGADPNRQDANGNTALSDAVSSTKSGPDIVRALIAAGADPTIENHHGTSPLAYVDMVDGMDRSIFDLDA